MPHKFPKRHNWGIFTQFSSERATRVSTKSNMFAHHIINTTLIQEHVANSGSEFFSYVNFSIKRLSPERNLLLPRTLILVTKTSYRLVFDSC